MKTQKIERQKSAPNCLKIARRKYTLSNLCFFPPGAPPRRHWAQITQLFEFTTAKGAKNELRGMFA
jgi:hypothetical protein